MTKLVDKTLLKAKVGSYLTGTAPALGDANLLGIARMRRREISQRMVALDAETSKRKILPGKYLISRKIDGEFTCLIFSHGEAVSLNPYGTVRTRAPFHGESEGEEGIVALSEAVGWFKIKPRHTIDLAVVGYSHGIEDRAHRLHSLLLAVVRHDGSYHMIGRTGGGFSDAQRLALVDDLAKRGADSSYVEVNSERVADKMIEPGLVAEIDCLDILSQTSDGSDIERNVGEVGGDLARGIEHGGQYPDPLTM